jgi:subtilisin family serine protease
MAMGESPHNDRLIKEVKWVLDAMESGAVSQRQRSAARLTSAGEQRAREYPGGAIQIAPHDWETHGVVDFMHRKSQILVDDNELSRVLNALSTARIDAQVADSLFGGVTLLQVDGEVEEVLGLLDGQLGEGVAVPNHMLSITPSHSLCPATEPAEVERSDPWPGLGDRDDGRGTRVAVVDSGFLQGWESRPQAPWLAGIDQYDIDDPDVLEPRGFIDPYAGHGTFVAGVIRALSPGAEVTVERVFEVAGVFDEASIVKQLGEGLTRSPDIINLSAGCYTRKNLPPKAFAAFWEHRLRHHKGVVLVAAAGNEGGRDPFWPAAFPWAVSVGALTPDGRERTKFSNHGGWVDVYAPGQDIVNAYCEGEYRLLLDRSVVRTFHGLCKWSGTSFSTPIVAGLIAARMSRTGENGRQAADALLEAARGQFLPGVGPRLLP